jgi:effector-binding domain-containing protein
MELLIALFFVALFFLGMAYFLPQAGHVERSIVIERPASQVFDMVNGFKRFDEWSPWHRKDQSMQTVVSGADHGFGATHRAESNDPKIGHVEQRIIESEPYRVVKISHNWDRFGNATMSFRFKPVDLGVQTTWAYDIDLGMNPIMRYRGLYMDSAIGEDLQMGLMRLKALLESTPFARDYSDIDVKTVDLQRRDALQTTGSVTVYTTDEVLNLPKAIDETVAKLNEFAQKNKLQVTGRPQVAMLSKDRYSASYDVYLPVSGLEDVKLPDDIKAGKSFGGKYLAAEHWGRRSLSTVTTEKMQAYMSVRGIKPIGEKFEELVGEMPMSNGNGNGDDEGVAGFEASTSEEGADEDPNTEFVTRIYFLIEALPEDVSEAADPTTTEGEAGGDEAASSTDQPAEG